MNLSELADIQMGYPFRSRLEHEPHGNVAVIQMKDVIGDLLQLEVADLARVQLSDLNPRYLIALGDILFRSRGQTNTAALVATQVSSAVVAAPTMRLRVKSEAIRPEYLSWFINQPKSQAYLRSELKGTSVLMISTESIGQMKVAVPPLQTQEAIVAMARLAALEQKLMQQVADKRQRHLDGILWRFAQSSRTKVR